MDTRHALDNTQLADFAGVLLTLVERTLYLNYGLKKKGNSHNVTMRHKLTRKPKKSFFLIEGSALGFMCNNISITG